MALNYAQLMEIPGGPGTDIGAIVAGTGVEITATGVMNTVNYQLTRILQGNLVIVTPPTGVGDVTLSSTVPGPGDLPVGSQMLFYQAAAPTNWRKITTFNNLAIRIVSGNSGGSEGGTLDFTEVFTPFTPSGNVSFVVQIGGTTSGANVVASGGVNFQGQVTPAVITNDRNPTHQHNISECVRDGYGGQQSWDQGGSTNLFASQNGSTQGGSGGHSHGLSGSLGFSGNNNNHEHGLFGSASTGTLTLAGTQMNLSVKYLDSIPCIKE